MKITSEIVNKDILVLILAKGIQVSIGLLSLRLLTEALDAEQLGIFYILQTLIALLAFGLLNPLGQYYSRHIIHWNKKNNLKTATVTLLLLRAATIPIALIISFAVYRIFHYDQYFCLTSYFTYIIVAIIALTYGVLLSATNVLIGRVQFAVYSVLTVITALTASIVFTKVQPTALAWAYGTALTQVCFSVHMFFKIVGNQKFNFQQISTSLRNNYHLKVAIFIVPVTVTLFLQWGQTSLFRIIIEHIYSIEILAFIGVGMAVSNAVFSAAESLANQYYMPGYLRRISGANKAKRISAWNDIAKILIPIYVALTVYMIIFSPNITKILVSDSYFSAYHYAIIGAVAELFRVIANLLYLVSQSEINTKRTLLPYVTSVLIIFCVFSFLNDTYDPAIVVITLAFANFVTMIIMYLQMSKLLTISIDFTIVIKLCKLLCPLLPILFLDRNQSFYMSILLLLLGACYTAGITYFCLTQSQKRKRK